MELNSALKEIKSLSKNQTLNGIKGVVTLEQDSTCLSFQLAKRTEGNLKQ